MKYKVGDKVRIKENLKENEAYGYRTVVTEMLGYQGKVATIKELYKGAYILDIDNAEWEWTDEMLEDVETDETEKDIVTLTIKEGELTVGIIGSPKYERMITQDSIKFMFNGKEVEE